MKPLHPAKHLDLTRWPRLGFRNLYLVVLLGMLGGAAWMSLVGDASGREPMPLLIVGAVTGFWFLLARGTAAPRRLRLEVTETHLKIHALRGRQAELLHDLARTDLKDLWLREGHPTEQGVPLRRGTSNGLWLMARTSDRGKGEGELALLCLRDAWLDVYGLDRLLLWLAEHLELPQG